MKKGKIVFPNNFYVKLSKENFKDMLQLYYFSIKYGVRLGDSWYVDLQNYIIKTPDSITFSLKGFDALIFAETFLYDSHFVDFDLSGRTIIQAGAYVRESGLYYAKKGAKVYALEPQPSWYNIAELNINLNPELSRKIFLINWVIDEDGMVEFPNITCSGDASLYKLVKDKVTVRSVSISTILDELAEEDADILDLDIKGQEFKVINDKSLRKFNVVRIEYSTVIEGKKLGNLNYLVSKLRDYGFNKIRIYKHNEGMYDLSLHGTINASM